MIATRFHHAVFAAVLACGFVSATAFADSGISKEACLDAHSRGQDAKDQGKISLARKLFLTCAQTMCPALVQGDCARFADDLSRIQPSLSFVARDGDGADLPDTTVYVDDMLVVTRLDDGKSHDVDPGKHTIKFQHAGKEKVVTIVVGSGEKGRAVNATFGEPHAAAASGDPKDARPTTKPEIKTTHPLGSKVLIGAGAVMLAGGTGLGLLGMMKVPSNCSISTNQCAAPPGDPSFDDAASAVKLANIGFVTAGVGLAALAGGVYWYVSKASTEKSEQVAVPWIGPSSAGFAVAGRF
jgi:hypothetical protein